MRDQAQFQSGDDPVANLGAITMTATTSCTDTIAPGDSAYDNAHAAEDIERLRSTWDVPSLALLGVGNGAQVALAYAGSHPDKVARLVLDSPIPLGINAEAAAEQQVKGQQAALDAFAAQCVAVNCALGPDPKGAVDSPTGGRPRRPRTRRRSVAALANAIVTALASPSGDRIASTDRLADTLAAARSGDDQPADQPDRPGRGHREHRRPVHQPCSDALNRPTPDRVRELVVAWGKLYPQFGTVGRAQPGQMPELAQRLGSRTAKNLKVNVLLLGVQNDPIVGNGGRAPRPPPPSSTRARPASG